MIHIHQLRSKQRFLTSGLALLLAINSASAADFNLAQCLANQLKYRVTGYTESSEGDLGLLPGSQEKLAQRVWNAFRSEVKKSGVDSTQMPITKWDLVPHHALTKAVINPQEAAVAQIYAMREAKHDIYLGTYIFGNDDYSYALRKEAMDAMARGVNVHVLIDSEGSFNTYHKELKVLHDAPKGNVLDDFGNPLVDASGKPIHQSATFTTVVFNPLTNFEKLFPVRIKQTANLAANPDRVKSLFRLFAHRMHTKLLLTDPDYLNAVGFIGGRNKHGFYYGYEKINEHTYNDAEVLIRNDPNHFEPGKKAISDSLAREYRKLSEHELNKALGDVNRLRDLATFTRTAEIYNKEVDKMNAASAAMWTPGGAYDTILQRMKAERFLETKFDAQPVQYYTQIHNINRPDVWTTSDFAGEANPASIVRAIKQFVAHSDKGTTVVTPYPNMTRLERKMLIKKMLMDPDYKFTMITNSLYSGDNIITQYVVDHVLIPSLKKEARAEAFKFATQNGKSKAEADVFAEAFVNRFKIYALGKLDGVLFGGTEFYGKLHAKYGIFESKDPAKTQTAVGSYNGDNISRLHNAEIMVAVPGEGNTYSDYNQYTQTLISKSYEWGSDDWKKVRESKQLRTKRLIEKAVSFVEKYIDPLE
jgi:phosphatidylserine/phosphatidylglycerophosphate/cardiolipin synthase-like enzyme